MASKRRLESGSTHLTTIKRALDASGIEIPFPQRVIRQSKE